MLSICPSAPSVYTLDLHSVGMRQLIGYTTITLLLAHLFVTYGFRNNVRLAASKFSSNHNALFMAGEPSGADELFSLGMELEQNGYFREANEAFQDAAKRYQRVLDSDNNDATDLSTRSKDELSSVLGYITIRLAHLSHDAMGDSQTSARLYQQASQIDPSMVSWHGVGNSLEAYDGTGSEDCLVSAIDAYRRALELSHGNNNRLMLDLAVALDRSGEIDESKQLMEELRVTDHGSSLVDSWDYVREHTSKHIRSNLQRGTRDMLQLALDQALPMISKSNGLVCEFGVASGRSIRMTREILTPEVTVHGFDTFTGLPEAWGNEPAGSYTMEGAIPRFNDGQDVQFHKGLFSDTIPSFLDTCTHEHKKQPLAYANIDCDLYSSTMDILQLFSDRIVPGTILLFDEYIGHETWREDEYQAWQECCQEFGWTYEYLAVSLSSKQVAVRVT